MSVPKLCVGSTSTLEQRGERSCLGFLSHHAIEDANHLNVLQVAALTAAGGTKVDHEKPYAELW